MGRGHIATTKQSPNWTSFITMKFAVLRTYISFKKKIVCVGISHFLWVRFFLSNKISWTLYLKMGPTWESVRSKQLGSKSRNWAGPSQSLLMYLIFALRVATVCFKTCSVNIVPKLIIFWRKASWTCVTCLLLRSWLGCVPRAVPGGSQSCPWSLSFPVCHSSGSPALQLSLCEQDGNWAF